MTWSKHVSLSGLERRVEKKTECFWRSNWEINSIEYLTIRREVERRITLAYYSHSPPQIDAETGKYRYEYIYDIDLEKHSNIDLHLDIDT